LIWFPSCIFTSPCQRLDRKSKFHCLSAVHATLSPVNLVQVRNRAVKGIVGSKLGRTLSMSRLLVVVNT